MSAIELLRHEGIRRLPLPFKLFVARRFGLISGARDRIMESGGMRYLSMHVPPLGSRGFDRFVDAHIRESRGERVLEIVNISLTPQCEEECWHCLYSTSERRKRDYLDTDSIKKAIGDMKAMGTYSVLLTGGDPLLHPDIMDIIREFDDRFVVNLATPGRHLTPQIAGRLKKAGLTGVFIGLDSSDKQRNDDYRSAGSYDTAISAIKAVREAGLLTGIFSVIRREQLIDGDVDSLISLARDLGISEIDLFEPAGPEDQMLDPEERKRLAAFQEAYNRKKGYPKVISGPSMDSPEFMGCTAGFNRIFIDYNGDVRPCQLLPVSYGNINDERLRDIWERMGVFQRPMNRCIFFENIQVLSGVSAKGSMDPEECREVCLAHERPVPLYYRKLGIR